MSRDRPLRLVTACEPAGVGFEARAPPYRDEQAGSSRGRLRLGLLPGAVRLRRWRCNVGCLSSLRHLRQKAVFLALLLGDAPGLLLAEKGRSCPLLARRRVHVRGALGLRTCGESRAGACLPRGRRACCVTAGFGRSLGLSVLKTCRFALGPKNVHQPWPLALNFWNPTRAPLLGSTHSTRPVLHTVHNARRSTERAQHAGVRRPRSLWTRQRRARNVSDAVVTARWRKQRR